MKFNAKYLKSDSWVIPTFAVAEVNEWEIKVEFAREGDPTGPDDSEDYAEATGYNMVAWPIDRSKATYGMKIPAWVQQAGAAMQRALDAAPDHININRLGVLEVEVDV